MGRKSSGEGLRGQRANYMMGDVVYIVSCARETDVK